ncbi:hypothetical protein ASPZODRAFT_132074 [Penicilliopsis zonata CBS 506.65]|uniref:CENP-Q, a CENPA-CAD centromere complex subunit-domain-containing protein n=1 Tax=Penicilliopsis zonata CBS 506.65 TaxID=1073090 RepID=A0A1L9SJ10_9EURO|nr:hypothetical protein ASPZODRAFT_132074 [Penicilliopsis zonata CBS 506.65]OJJ47127.1 hypothetical protein ASPZODRAFT_132074 [Penicilliopsis zonata CBS 506.65]
MPPKRKRAEQPQDQSPDTSSSKRFAFLKPQVRNVPERTIKSKWTTLPEPAQEKVRDIFRTLERPVIVRHGNERKRIEAQAAVQAVVRNLGRRLTRIPFPPATKESNFEYETALDEHRSLEDHLGTVTDSIDLLKAQIAKEEALLARENKQLEELRKNAKAAETERKRQLKNEHPIIQQLGSLPPGQPSGRTEVKFSETKDLLADLSDLDADADVLNLLKQINGHLQSLQTNTAPLDGLSDAITRSQAALSLFSASEG